MQTFTYYSQTAKIGKRWKLSELVGPIVKTTHELGKKQLKNYKKVAFLTFVYTSYNRVRQSTPSHLPSVFQKASFQKPIFKSQN